MFPEIMNGGGESEEDIKRAEECLKAACEALPNSLFEELIRSMKSRIDMSIKADGHTKY